MSSSNGSVPFARSQQDTDSKWVPFSGGELEGRPSAVKCAVCRHRGSPSATLCFECHRAGLAHERALKRAANVDTASDVRFQTTLPFEPINHARLARLRVERAHVRTAGAGGFDERRRRAQIAARHALQRLAAGLADRGRRGEEQRVLEREFSSAIHAAQLQLPPSWLPFVVGQS